MWRRRILEASRSAAVAAASFAPRSAAARLRPFSSSDATRGRRFAALWGNGDFGRLGLGGLDSQWKPTVCPFFIHEDDSPVAIACGGAHTLFLTEKGQIYASGLNSFGQLGIPTSRSHVVEPILIPGLPDNIVKISAGYYHSAAVTEDGELFMWGKNSNGQLGLGKKSPSIICTPEKVDSLLGIHIKAVSLGAEHSLALTDEGDALSWGEGGSGRLGHGHQSGIFGFSKNLNEYIPRLIQNFEDVKVKNIAAGLLHSACINENGSVFIFGERTAEKLGFGEKESASTPSIVRDIPFSEEVACGGYHTCIITCDGTLYSWGSNENGCLGLGHSDMMKSPQKVENPALRFSITEVSCGWKHTAVICGGNVFTWGWGGANGTFFEDGQSSGGQLGHGNDMDFSVPMMVDFGRGVKALQVSCGFNHTGVILEHI